MQSSLAGWQTSITGLGRTPADSPTIIPSLYSTWASCNLVMICSVVYPLPFGFLLPLFPPGLSFSMDQFQGGRSFFLYLITNPHTSTREWNRGCVQRQVIYYCIFPGGNQSNLTPLMTCWEAHFHRSIAATASLPYALFFQDHRQHGYPFQEEMRWIGCFSQGNSTISRFSRVYQSWEWCLLINSCCALPRCHSKSYYWFVEIRLTQNDIQPGASTTHHQRGSQSSTGVCVSLWSALISFCSCWNISTLGFSKSQADDQ